jgi:hypothetical protein
MFDSSTSNARPESRSVGAVEHVWVGAAARETMQRSGLLPPFDQGETNSKNNREEKPQSRRGAKLLWSDIICWPPATVMVGLVPGRRDPI